MIHARTNKLKVTSHEHGPEVGYKLVPSLYSRVELIVLISRRISKHHYLNIKTMSLS